MDDLSLFHNTAHKHYDHLSTEKLNIEFILSNLTEEFLTTLLHAYSNSNQFNMNRNIRGAWNANCAEQLSGIQEDIFIFLCNMFFCEKNRKRRKERMRLNNCI